jgi:prephenate dehydrogenase
VARPTVQSLPPPDQPRFRRVAIVGVGLIGGSIGMALRARGLATEVVGVDRSAETLARAQALGAIDEGSLEIGAVESADCVVFAAPVGVLADLFASAAPFIAPDAVITDVGSVKRGIVALGEQLFSSRFVGGHPMAGSEASGVEAARPDLFEGAAWALTPAQSSGAAMAVAAVTTLVTDLGARPVHLTAPVHDHLVGLVSHLPHALSFAFARIVSQDTAAAAAIDIAGGSYTDLTRVSRSSPELWADILLANRDELGAMLAEYEASLRALREAVESGDRAAVLERLTIS